jgi:hypothetical protein
MRALASFQDLYVGLEPYRNQKQIGGGVWTSTAPAVFGLLAAIELHPTNHHSGGEYRNVIRNVFIVRNTGISTLADKYSLRSEVFVP